MCISRCCQFELQVLHCASRFPREIRKPDASFEEAV
jgi:hypothetical protein